MRFFHRSLTHSRPVNAKHDGGADIRASFYPFTSLFDPFPLLILSIYVFILGRDSERDSLHRKAFFHNPACQERNPIENVPRKYDISPYTIKTTTEKIHIDRGNTPRIL